MKNIKNKWGIIFKAFCIVTPVILFKLIFHFLGWEVISVGPVITALVAGVFFVIAIILSGVLQDYKESEKMPGELTASIEALYKDSMLVCSKDATEGMLDQTMRNQELFQRHFLSKYSA
jgi:hypothetical protein